MVLHIRSSKTDQLRKGNEIVIARTGSETCPVGILKSYFCLGRIVNMSEEKLFQGISKTKKRERLRATGGLSYTRWRELLLAKL